MKDIKKLVLDDKKYCDNCGIVISEKISKKTETCAGYIYCEDCKRGGYREIELYLED